MNFVRTTFSLSKEAKKMCYDLAKEKHQTLSQVIKDALEMYYRHEHADKPIEVESD